MLGKDESDVGKCGMDELGGTGVGRGKGGGG